MSQPWKEEPWVDEEQGNWLKLSLKTLFCLFFMVAVCHLGGVEIFVVAYLGGVVIFVSPCC